MDLSSRYEILDTIAGGDFATVLRARDRELGREVAIKQIHQQFLADPQQLARYWREAQLLASLQHPNILTIYDIVRPRGWLILELMQGSLKERAQGEPLDLDSLRTVLAAGLGALQFLHSNGVIHGDVKPGNLLVDAQSRVKLGDFGLARRATSEEGSLLKGTTKYMAPELVSDQFGAVGPASDLYSLGFSAYELLCGRHFESLFPGLGSFGRDRQIAWMMWHAAADRRLPEIGHILEGVPEDLAGVIQKMTAKDQAQRYATAEDALRDLSGGRPVAEQMGEEDGARLAAAAAAAARRKRRLRLVAVFAMALSVTLCAALLFTGEKPAPSAQRGVIVEVDGKGRGLTLISSEDQRVRKLSFTRHDRFLVNDEPARLEDLRLDDQVVVSRVRDATLGHEIVEVRATRPISDSGHIREIARPGGTEPARVMLTIERVDQGGGELVVWVPQHLEIVFNGETQLGGQPVTAGDLEPGDRVVVEHVAEGQTRKAIKLVAQRVVEEAGVICREVEGGKASLAVEIGEGDQRKVRVFPFADNCKVTINDQPFKAPTDLRQGDRVSFQHDSRVVSVSAHRMLRDTGQVERIDADRLQVALSDGGRTAVCQVSPECKISLFGEPVGLSDLRRGDLLEITHDSLDRAELRPSEIAALRPADTTRWAIIVAVQKYADGSLTRITHPVGDARLLRDTLVKRYWVPEGQALLLTDEDRARLEARIPQQLARIGPAGKLLVYFAGHAYQDDQGSVYLAPADFELARIGETGLPLQWLLDELEGCRAGEKLLLLDCCQAGQGADLRREPSTAEMLGTLRGPPGWAALRTVTAVASCGPGQRGLVREDNGRGLFAWSLGQAYGGRADRDGDQRVDPTELLTFLGQEMGSAAGQRPPVQTPVLLSPDNRPPRLAEAAKREILRLAEFVERERIDFSEADPQYAAATRAAAGQPEPKLIYGLLLLKGRRREGARRQFAELKLEHPDWLVPAQGVAWTWFEERGYTAGLAELRELVLRIPRPGAEVQYSPQQIDGMLTWVGQLRQYAEIAAERGSRVPAQSLADLDAAVAALGQTAGGVYDRGRQQSSQHRQQIESQAEQERLAGNLAATSQLLTVERFRLESYAAFPLDEIVKQIEGNLDRREPQY